MQLRNWMVLVFLALFFLGHGSLEARDFSKVVIKTIPVNSGVYMLMGMGGNIGVSVGESGILIVDDQFAPLVPKIRAALKKLNPKPVKFVVNTHWHPDHTGGNEPLGQGGAIIVANENVRKRLSTEQFNTFLKSKTPPAPKAALPVITFTRDVDFHFNGEDIHVFHVDPAHTDGDSIVYFKQAKVLHMGDIYFSQTYPFIDTGSGGNIDGMIAATDRVLKDFPADTVVIPGHGKLSNMAELKAYRDMLVAVRDRVVKLKKAGKSSAEVVAAKPTAEFDARWGQGWMKPDTFIGIVYASLR